jgi:hypothetical protein
LATSPLLLLLGLSVVVGGSFSWIEAAEDYFLA